MRLIIVWLFHNIMKLNERNPLKRGFFSPYTYPLFCFLQCDLRYTQNNDRLDNGLGGVIYEHCVTDSFYL